MNINATLLGQMISFAIFVWICMKFVWPVLIQIMKDREAKIAEGLAAAERGEHEQELAEQRAKELLKDAKVQAADVLAQAQKRGNELVEEAKSTASAEGERIKASAQAEIEQQVNQAKTALREHVVEIALKGTEQILKREVDAKAHKEVLDDLVSQV